MKRRRPRRTFTVLVLLAGLVIAAVPAAKGFAEEPSISAATGTTSPEQALIRRMVGTWEVRASLWLGPDAKPIVQSAVATRRLVGDGLLEEAMTPSASPEGAAFTRLALFGFNAVNSRYEYVSWDTRAPQMMYQVSRAVSLPGERPTSAIWLDLVDNFVVPQWGEGRNVAFRQRLMIEPGVDRQVFRLYWTRLSGEPTPEFLAGEYVYTRRP